MEALEKARIEYRSGNINIHILTELFYKEASEVELDRFYSAPVFDRAGIIIGKTQAQLDQEWEQIIN